MQRKPEQKHIALFGGAFNPPHEGHLQSARAVLDAMPLDGVWMLVTPQAAYKKRDYVAAFKHRLAMTRILTRHDSNIRVSDAEKEFYTGQTIATLRGLRQKYPHITFYWVMGEDNLHNFHTWAHFQEILDNFPIIVVSREQALSQDRGAVFAQYKNYMQDDTEKLKEQKNGIYYLQMPAINIQSQDITKAIQSGKSRIAGLDPQILSYIKRHKIFKVPTAQNIKRKIWPF